MICKAGNCMPKFVDCSSYKRVVIVAIAQDYISLIELADL